MADDQPMSAFVVGAPGTRFGAGSTAAAHRICQQRTALCAGAPFFETIQQKLFGWAQNGAPAQEHLPGSDSPKNPKTAVVFGGTGRVGSEVVRQLLADGVYNVVVTGRSEEKFNELFDNERVKFEQFDLLNSRAVRQLSSKADTIFWVAGPSQGESSLDVDELAVEAMVRGRGKAIQSNVLLDFSRSSTARMFSRLDDVIMGGKSSSSIVQEEGYASFKGNVTLEQNGGFCQVRQVFPGPRDWSRGEGLLLKVRGDGRRYKVNLKNTTEPEFVWQADFDTKADGEWGTVRLPFDTFVPVKRGKVLYGDGTAGLYDETLDLTKIRSISFVQSKVGIGIPKCPAFVPGQFFLDVESVELFVENTPRIILLSSAGVTRPGWSEEMKQTYPAEASIPIVQLNPGKILDHKLAGEQAVRKSGIPYCIVRATSLNDEHPNGVFECSQGDILTGRINRKDVADFLMGASRSPSAAFKTMEVRTTAGTRRVPLKDSFFKKFDFDSTS